jgi:hypothetical protein
MEKLSDRAAQRGGSANVPPSCWHVRTADGPDPGGGIHVHAHALEATSDGALRFVQDEGGTHHVTMTLVAGQWLAFYGLAQDGEVVVYADAASVKRGSAFAIAHGAQQDRHLGRKPRSFHIAPRLGALLRITSPRPHPRRTSRLWYS